MKWVLRWRHSAMPGRHGPLIRRCWLSWLSWLLGPAQWSCMRVDMKQPALLTILVNSKVRGAITISCTRKISPFNRTPSTTHKCVTLACLVPVHQIIACSIEASTIETRGVGSIG
ncbi:hypothetical protein Xcaj_16315 [Xanthomonas axonopodis pv. cajani]|uniref:Secreted protein n=1 Tax=Xanthomonas axonopodis pv. cajani TaxID=487827 RepID=A0ABX3M7C6_9XANT|nr:hypothetical protein Xcaj_16315 [Xanthomonas axonopodis pv. cajani]